jgi:deoxyribose-phosphate aldolase
LDSIQRQATSSVKAFEAQEVVSLGADEVDMVINIGKLLEGDLKFVYSDIGAVVGAANRKPVKVSR